MVLMNIEDLLYSAYEHGQRNAMLEEVSKIKAHYPQMIVTGKQTRSK